MCRCKLCIARHGVMTSVALRSHALVAVTVTIRPYTNAIAAAARSARVWRPTGESSRRGGGPISAAHRQADAAAQSARQLHRCIRLPLAGSRTVRCGTLARSWRKPRCRWVYCPLAAKRSKGIGAQQRAPGVESSDEGGQALRQEHVSAIPWSGDDVAGGGQGRAGASSCSKALRRPPGRVRRLRSNETS